MGVLDRARAGRGGAAKPGGSDGASRRARNDLAQEYARAIGGSVLMVRPGRGLERSRCRCGHG